MNKIFTALILFFLSFGLFAQNAKPEPLRAILKSIEKQHHVRFMFLDSDVGTLEIIPPPPNETLSFKIDYIGQLTGLAFAFQDGSHIAVTKSDEISQTHADTLSQQLNEVVIEQYLAKGISKNSDGSLRIAPHKFGLLPGLTEADVLQTMQQIPGILSVDETISNINVRGGTHDQNLFLWNGVRMFQTGHFFGLVSGFSPQLPQNIDVYKNGTPANFGEGVSSTVNISTKSPDSLSAGFAANFISAELFAQFKLSPNAGLTVSGRRSITDWASTPTYRDYSDRIFQHTLVTDLRSNETVKYGVDKNFYFYDFSLRYDQKVGTRSKFAISGIGMFNALDVMQKRVDLDQLSSRNSHLDQQNFGASVDWMTKWSDKTSTFASAYFSLYGLDASNRSVESQQQLDQQNNVLDTGLRISNRHRFSENLTFENGYQYNETGISNYDDVNDPDYHRRTKTVLRNHALTAQLGYTTQDATFWVKPGLRVNYFDRFGKLRIEPRLQSGLKLSETLRIEALAELKSQTASQIIDLQQDFLGLEKRRWMASDDRSVPIQKSVQSSLGVVYDESGWLLTLDGFFKKVRGITTASQSFQNQLEFVRINGDYKVWGAEALLQKTFANNFRAWASYSFNRNEYTFNSLTPPDFANNFEIVHAVTSALSYEGKRFKSSLGARWYTGKPQTTPLSGQAIPNFGQIDYNDPNNSNLDDYFQANFSSAYSWQLARRCSLTAGLSVLNVFDNRNIINRYYRLTDDNSIERVNTFALSRTFNVSLKVLW